MQDCLSRQQGGGHEMECPFSVRQIGSPGARDNQFFYGQLNNWCVVAQGQPR